MKLCECGCGEPAPIATNTDTKHGRVKGEPLRFVNHHRSRLPIPARDEANRSRTRPLAERFAEKYIVRDDGCWQWAGSIGTDGYGHFLADGRIARADRVAYELHIGEIPEGMEMHHICKRRWCVNPEHVIPVTRPEHVEIERHLTCKWGHPRRQAPNGKWVCPKCQAAATRRYQARKRGMVS